MASVAIVSEKAVIFPTSWSMRQLSKNRDLANFLRGFQIVITFSFTSFAPWTNNELECSHAENFEDVLKCGGEQEDYDYNKLARTIALSFCGQSYVKLHLKYKKYVLRNRNPAMWTQMR